LKNTTSHWRNRIVSLMFSAAALGGLHGTAQAAPTLSLTVLGQTSVAWGSHLAAPTLRVTLSETRSCAGPFSPQAESLTLRIGVSSFPQAPMTLTCSGGVFSVSADLPFDVLYAFGAHYVTVQYSGKLGTAVSAPVFITLRPEYNFITPGGPIFTALATTASNCRSRAASLQDREALDVSPPPPPPITVKATNKELRQGGLLFHEWCAVCHGLKAVAGGVVPDLRKATAETHASFAEIVLGGVREAKGMPSFADVLKPEDARLIQAYVVARALEAQPAKAKQP
jgi:mono/diheme cytochrome c family protein